MNTKEAHYVDHGPVSQYDFEGLIAYHDDYDTDARTGETMEPALLVSCFNMREAVLASALTAAVREAQGKVDNDKAVGEKANALIQQALKDMRLV